MDTIRLPFPAYVGRWDRTHCAKIANAVIENNQGIKRVEFFRAFDKPHTFAFERAGWGKVIEKHDGRIYQF